MSRSSFIAQENQPEESGHHLPDWREAMAILLERAWLGVLVAVVVFLFFFLNAHRQIPYYRSTATLLVEAQIPKILNYQDILSFNTRNLEYFNTHLNALHSRSMMEEALNSSGLMDNPDFLPELESPEEKVSAVRGMVVITPVEKSRMIGISVEYSDPRIASDLANALARSYIQQDLDNRMSASMEAIEWLRARSDEYREKLEKGLLELQEYREKTGSVSLEEDQNIVIEKLKALNAALTAAETERIQAETEWKSVQAQIDEQVPMSKVAALLNDPGVLAALQKLQEQQREVTRLRQRYKERHPDLIQAVELEQKLQNQLEKAGTDAVHALKSRYEMLQAQEKNLQKALKQQEKEAFELDRKLVHYDELKRRIQADQEIHQAVIARMNEANISESQPADIIRMVEEARPARTPFRPRLGQAMIRGAVLGLVLGLGAIFLFYYTDHRFRRNEEVERRMGIPVLGTIPLVTARTLQERGQISHLDPAGEISESFKTLRASLLLKKQMKRPSVLMLTSTGAGEGKSLISSNLAISLAQDGRRTLLMGVDLRRPVLEKIFASAGHSPGLAGVLKREANWRDVLLRHEVPHLDVMPAGSVQSPASELLGSPPFGAMLEEVRGIYDYIIMDAPPLLGVSDSLVLLPHADAVLYVIRYGVTHSFSAFHAVRKLEDAGVPCLGCIMNGVNFRTMANYFYYRRYGGYAYKAPYEADETAASGEQGGA